MARKCCGLEQSGMVTVDLNPMSILTRKPLVACLINSSRGDLLFHCLHIPLSRLLNRFKAYLDEMIGKVRK